MNVFEGLTRHVQSVSENLVTNLLRFACLKALAQRSPTLREVRI